MDELQPETIPAFGRKIRDSLFFLDPEAAFTNHGSFGTVPRPVMAAHVALLRQVDANPDVWFRYAFRPLYLKSCEAAAKFVGASLDEVVLVENATTAVNTVMKGLRLGAEDGVLMTTLAYTACRHVAEVVCRDSGAECHVMNIKLPVTRESVVRQYDEFLERHANVRFALVDHITSPSAVLLPVRGIVEVCHRHGVSVMIDGAHAPGQLDINVKTYGAEYYTGTFHKWMFCPRGCAVLYVKNGLQSSVKPLVVSWLHFKDFHDRFIFQATRDYTSYCILQDAIDFYNRIGGLPAISAYNTSLMSWAVDMLCQHLNIHRLPIPQDMQSPFMSVFSLPDCLGPPTSERAQELMGKLLDEYNVQTAIDAVDGRLWFRISVQVYNIKEDYTRLAEALEQEIKRASSL